MVEIDFYFPDSSFRGLGIVVDINACKLIAFAVLYNYRIDCSLFDLLDISHQRG